MGPKKVLYAHFIYDSVLGVSKIQITCELVVMTVMSSTEILGVEQKSLEAKMFKFLNQCFARLWFWKSVSDSRNLLDGAGDTFPKPKSCKILI